MMKTSLSGKSKIVFKKNHTKITALYLMILIRLKVLAPVLETLLDCSI